ncbi:MAG: zinc-ribbon domain-containing protein [Clostridia bacterium]|nr:zinc-ribbon domain-containing protein [Clostridia bacterium]
MAFCKNCGARLNEDSKFCPSCGTPVTPAQSAPRVEVMDEQPDCNKWFGVLAYLGPVLFVPMFVRKNSKFAQFHVRQGFNLLCFWVVLVVARYTLGIIPYIGTHFLKYVFGIGLCGVAVFSIIGIINALLGKKQPLPIFGDKLDLLKLIFKM